jgi:hypothetical protein
MNQPARFLLLCLFSVLIIPASQATHIRGGEITYTMDPANPLRVTYNVTIYRDDTGVLLESIELDVGDGNRVRIVDRTTLSIGGRTERMDFRYEHQYAAPGTYLASVSLQNRNPGVVNLPSPSDVFPFYIETQILLNPAVSANNPLRFLANPLFFTPAGRPYRHNILAFDPDHDSLSYQLAPVKFSPAQTSPGYFIPDSVFIDAISGELVWHTPELPGEYIFAIEVTEWKSGIAVCKVRRDFQVLVYDISENQRLEITESTVPELLITNRVRVEPGALIQFRLIFSDAESFRREMTAFDELLAETGSAGWQISDSLEYKVATFSWQPGNENVRAKPYIIVLRSNSILNTNGIFDPYFGTDYTITLYVGADIPEPVITSVSRPTREGVRLRVFPNPVHDALEFRLDNQNGFNEFTLIIVDALGREVLQREFRGEAAFRVDVRHQVNGWYVYYLRDKKRGRTFSGKYVKY